MHSYSNTYVTVQCCVVLLALAHASSQNVLQRQSLCILRPVPMITRIGHEDHNAQSILFVCCMFTEVQSGQSRSTYAHVYNGYLCMIDRLRCAYAS